VAEVDAAEAFDRAQRIGMWMAVVIEPAAFLEARGLDDGRERPTFRGK